MVTPLATLPGWSALAASALACLLGWWLPARVVMLLTLAAWAGGVVGMAAAALLQYESAAWAWALAAMAVPPAGLLALGAGWWRRRMDARRSR